jgi:hypothetical protein
MRMRSHSRISSRTNILTLRPLETSSRGLPRNGFTCASGAPLSDLQSGLITARIAAHLLQLPTAPDYALAPGVGHQHLADMAGCPRTLVTQTLVQMREIGVVEMSQHGVLITNRIRLARIAAMRPLP